MKIRMTRTLGIRNPEMPVRKENEVYEVTEEEATSLVEAGLAVLESGTLKKTLQPQMSSYESPGEKPPEPPPEKPPSKSAKQSS